MIPSADYNTFKKVYSDVVITKPDGTNVTEGLIGTGYKITTGGKTYTAIKLGDTNGDGRISASDYVKVENHIMGVATLKDSFLKSADTNQNDSVTAADYVKIENHIMEIHGISL